MAMMSSATTTTTAAQSQPATSSSPVRVAVYVTGFGPFANVQVNPSATIARRVASALRARMAHPHPGDRVVIAAVEEVELETSVHATSMYFAALATSLDALLARDATLRVLLFHIGLHSGERGGVLRVELRGYNELHASVPDVRGVRFDHDVIVESDGDVQTCLDSYFGQPDSPALQRLTAFVRAHEPPQPQQEQGQGQQHDGSGYVVNVTPVPHAGYRKAAETNTGTLHMPVFLPPRWALSHNAGRYLCNCTLYHALRLQQQHRGRVAAVFVHVADPTKRATPTTASSDGSDTTAGPASAHVSTAAEPTTTTTPTPQHDDAAAAVVREVYNPTMMAQIDATMQLMHELLDMMADMQ